MSGPLDGVRVVDLSRVLAGPYASMVLADLGADVVKVERPGTGDDARHIGPFLPDGTSAYFASVNRGKRSVSLDLRDDGDRARLDALLDDADVLVENFRPGVLDRLGYGWPALHGRWPRTVLASVSGFGQTGPLAERPAYDMVVQAMGGIMSVTGQPGGEPTRVGTSIGDLAGGLFLVIGVLAALRDRERTGVGQHVDVAMLDAQVAILENAIARTQVTGVAPGPLGARHPSITPFGAFRARDGWLVVAAGNDDLFRSLAAVLGDASLGDDPRFGSNADRCEHEAVLRTRLEALLDADDVARWLERLEAAGIPCGPIHDVAEVLAHPQVAARQMVVEVDGLDGFRVAGNPIKLSGHPDPDRRGPVPPLS